MEPEWIMERRTFTREFKLETVRSIAMPGSPAPRTK